MSEITEAHITWSIVDRLARMLKDVNQKYSVTQAFGLLSPILCCTLQQIRSSDERVAPIHSKLCNSGFKQLSWGVSETDIVCFQSETISDVSHLDALRFLIGLRNASAHGDERKVIPINSHPDNRDRCKLIGFQFKCSYFENRRMVWSGDVKLRENQMRNIASSLAEELCNCYTKDDPDFLTVASRVGEGA
jgi:hypothetical protein